MKVKEAAQVAKNKSADMIQKAKEKTEEMLYEEKFSMESLEDPKHVTNYLRSVIDGIEKGRIVLAADDNELILYPGSLLKFSIMGKSSSHRGNLSINLSWSRLAEDRDQTIKITP